MENQFKCIFSDGFDPHNLLHDRNLTQPDLSACLRLQRKRVEVHDQEELKIPICLFQEIPNVKTSNEGHEESIAHPTHLLENQSIY